MTSTRSLIKRQIFIYIRFGHFFLFSWHPLGLATAESAKWSVQLTYGCSSHVCQDVAHVVRCVCGGGEASEAWACNVRPEIARGHAGVGKYGGWAHAMMG